MERLLALSNDGRVAYATQPDAFHVGPVGGGAAARVEAEDINDLAWCGDLLLVCTKDGLVRIRRRDAWAYTLKVGDEAGDLSVAPGATLVSLYGSSECAGDVACAVLSTPVHDADFGTIVGPYGHRLPVRTADAMEYVLSNFSQYADICAGHAHSRCATELQAASLRGVCLAFPRDLAYDAWHREPSMR